MLIPPKGAIIDLGTFTVRDGHADWAVPTTIDAHTLSQAQLTIEHGRTLARATFTTPQAGKTLDSDKDRDKPEGQGSDKPPRATEDKDHDSDRDRDHGDHQDHSGASKDTEHAHSNDQPGSGRRRTTSGDLRKHQSAGNRREDSEHHSQRRLHVSIGRGRHGDRDQHNSDRSMSGKIHTPR
jgi:hypothetical protein